METRIVPNGLPKKNEIYVISGFNISSTGILGLLITGFPVFTHTGKDIGFQAWRFRKLEDIREINQLRNEITELKGKWIETY